MSTFKIGDKVREIESGDVGIYKGEHILPNTAWIEWITGAFEGKKLYSRKNTIELVEAHKMTKNKPHKHAELIKAWADGAEIEYCDNPNNYWYPTNYPTWNTFFEYRLKPIPKPDIIHMMFVEAHPTLDNAYNQPNLELTFDPDSGALKAAKVL